MLFVKIKQQDDNKIIFDSIAYFMRVYVIYIIFPKASQFDLQACAKIKCFEYENKESRESSNHTERLS